MELASVIPDWLVWLAAGGVGIFALALLARGVEALLDLDFG